MTEEEYKMLMETLIQLHGTLDHILGYTIIIGSIIAIASIARLFQTP